LPSVASLKSLRSYARTSSAPSPFAGFGNPLLSGQDGKDRSAWAKQTCGDNVTPQLVAGRKPVRSPLRALYRDRYADVEAIRHQTPLPETADEVCFVAKALGASPDAIFLGSNATKTRIKSLSDSGTLKSWRVPALRHPWPCRRRDAKHVAEPGRAGPAAHASRCRERAG
jgi:hypothetical protein